MDQLGRYRIVREIGRGGMGAVYEAEDTQLKRRVALKVVREGDVEPDFIARLRREATIAAQFQHPNIVAVHDVGSAPDAEGKTVHFIAMGLVEGRTLADLMGTIDRKELLRILEEVARAVHYAHERGVVHRDLKPANILIDSGMRPLLADFGLARSDAHLTRITQSNTAIGTPLYMAPEQVGGEAADARTDVYALGIILYEALTGAPPFRGDSIPAIFQQILAVEATSPRALGKSVDRDLEVVCLKAVEKGPSDRYSSALEFAEDLARARQGEPIRAKPPGLVAVVGKRLARRRAVVAVSLAALALVAILLPWVLGERRRSLEQLRKRTDTALKAALQFRRAGQIEAMEEFARETEEACRETMGAFPSLAEPHYRLGRMHRARMRDDEAIAEQDRALAKEAGFAPARYERVVLTARRWRARVDRLIADRWGDEGFLLVRQEGRSQGRLKEQLARDPEGAALKARLADDLRKIDVARIGEGPVACAQGLLAWVEGDPKRARERLTAAIAKEPTLEEGYEALAMVELDEPGYEASVAWWTQGLAADQGYLPHVEGRAFALLLWAIDRGQKGEDAVETTERAIADLLEAIKRSPRGKESRLRLGLARMALAWMRGARGEDERELTTRAIADFTSVVQSDPWEERAWTWRGMANSGLSYAANAAGQDPTELCARAISDLDTAIRINPSRDTPWIYRGVVRGVLVLFRATRLQNPSSECERAIADLDQAIRLNAERHDPWIWRGVAQGVLAIYAPPEKKPDLGLRAFADLDQAVALAPARAEPWLWRGEARILAAWLKSIGGIDPLPEYAKGIADLEKSLSLQRRNPLGWRYLGDALEFRATWTALRGGSGAPDARAALEAYAEAARINPALEPALAPRVAACRKLAGLEH